MITAQIEKPTLLELRRQQHLTSRALAKEAEVPLGQAYTVEIGGFCQEATAKRVLAAFNRLSQKSYTLEDIQWQRWQLEMKRPYRGAYGH